MNQFEILDILGLASFLGGVLLLYFQRQRRRLTLPSLLPYLLFLMAVAAAYLDGRPDWYMLLLSLPFAGLLHLAMRARS